MARRIATRFHLEEPLFTQPLRPSKGWIRCRAGILLGTLLGIACLAGCSRAEPAQVSEDAAADLSEENPVAATENLRVAAAVSPEEAFRRARQAASAGEWRTFCDYLTPEACDTLAVTLMIVGDQLVQQAQRAGAALDPDRADAIRRRVEPIDAVLRRHQIPGNVLMRLGPDQLDAMARTQSGDLRGELLQPLVKLIADRAEFAADMLSVLQTARGRRAVVSLKGELAEVTEAGETAHATLVAHDDVGIETRRELDFRRVAGNWRIDFRLR